MASTATKISVLQTRKWRFFPGARNKAVAKGRLTIPSASRLPVWLRGEPAGTLPTSEHDRPRPRPPPRAPRRAARVCRGPVARRPGRRRRRAARRQGRGAEPPGRAATASRPASSSRSTGRRLGRDAHALAVAAYRELGRAHRRAEPAVAVRSSAADEDGADASFAGQHDTFLGVRGADRGAGGARAAAAPRSAGRPRAGLPPRQRPAARRPRAPPCSSSSSSPPTPPAVVFSANPVTGARDEVLVNAALGPRREHRRRHRHARRRARSPAPALASARRTIADKRAHDRPRRPAAAARSTFPAAAPPALARRRAGARRRRAGRSASSASSASPSTSRSPGPARTSTSCSAARSRPSSPDPGGSMTVHADPSRRDAAATPGFPVAWRDPATRSSSGSRTRCTSRTRSPPLEAAMLRRALGPRLRHDARVPAYERADRATSTYARSTATSTRRWSPSAAPPEEMARAGPARRGQAVLAGHRAPAASSGSASGLPEIRDHLGRLGALRPRTRLARRARRPPRRRRGRASAACGSSTSRSSCPSYLAISEFDELYRGLFAGQRPAATPTGCSRASPTRPSRSAASCGGSAASRCAARRGRRVLEDVAAGRRAAPRSQAQRGRAARSWPSSRATSPPTGAAATCGPSPRRAGSRTRRRSSRSCGLRRAARTPTRPAARRERPGRRARARRSPRRASGWPATRPRSSASSRPCSRPPRTAWSSPRTTTSGSTSRRPRTSAQVLSSRSAGGSSHAGAIDDAERRLHAHPRRAARPRRPSRGADLRALVAARRGRARAPGGAAAAPPVLGTLPAAPAAGRRLRPLRREVLRRAARRGRERRGRAARLGRARPAASAAPRGSCARSPDAERLAAGRHPRRRDHRARRGRRCSRWPPPS